MIHLIGRCTQALHPLNYQDLAEIILLAYLRDIMSTPKCLNHADKEIRLDLVAAGSTQLIVSVV